METTVCRVVLAMLLYSRGASPAPQDTSSITYVRQLPEVEDQPGPPRESRVENLPLLIGGIGAVNESRVEELERLASDSQLDLSTPTNPLLTREDPTTTSYEDTTLSTEEPTTAATERPRLPAPRFTSKLSYFRKTSAAAVDANLVERTGKRKFRSRCRCEKIWNCPKLQITVPRCPEEYFLCCF